jgi:spore maturation protein CgeB
VGVKYVSWVYDSPALNLFSYTLINPCNYVFLFDSQMYELFASQGIKTIYYLPMAAPADRYDTFEVSSEKRKRYGGQVSFVGNLYTEGHNYYDRIKEKISDYSRGYIEGLMKAQMEVSGIDLVEKSLPGNVMKDMIDALGAKPNYDGVETYEYIYSNYVVNRKITATERTEILTMIGEKYPVTLYTGDASFKAKNITNKGKIDYYEHMPYVFKNSDVNLNITLRSIQRGIPLRCMDIMGCGGFLLTNFQEDLLNFFVPGEDFVYYESRSDLMDKLDYYLTHEDERMKIAGNGYEKVKANHTYKNRVVEMLEIVKG